MNTTETSLACGMIVYVFCYIGSGMSGILSLVAAAGATIAIWAAQRVPIGRKPATARDLRYHVAPRVRRDATQRANSLRGANA